MKCDGWSKGLCRLSWPEAGGSDWGWVRLNTCDVFCNQSFDMSVFTTGSVSLNLSNSLIKPFSIFLFPVRYLWRLSESPAIILLSS